MRILDAKLHGIKMDTLAMMQLVQLQLQESTELLHLGHDEEKIRAIKKREKKVDKCDIKINRDCERFLAVCTPVADDLRTVMTINNILPSLERISDVSEKIAKFARKYPQPFEQELIEKTGLHNLMASLLFMYNSVVESFADNSTLKLNDVFVKDKEINAIYKSAKKTIIELLQESSLDSEKKVNLLLIISKLERAGDHIKTIAEEIYFCVEGVFMRHKHE
ncbi:MAG TPA: phosphate signaling complex protein PhoU [Bacteroidales bacterium]|nr:phosphate signaling complex protein PhoU [Bacteroidales bacterium]